MMMGFSEAVKVVMNEKYATFTGRATRSEYWWFQLFRWGIFIAIHFIGIILQLNYDENRGEIYTAALIIAVIFFLATLLPSIAVAIRRLHDRDMSGWWYLAFLAIGLVVTDIPWLVLMCLEGTKKKNRYGAVPKRKARR